jgi:hypothetical protein
MVKLIMKNIKYKKTKSYSEIIILLLLKQYFYNYVSHSKSIIIKILYFKTHVNNIFIIVPQLVGYYCHFYRIQ